MGRRLMLAAIVAGLCITGSATARVLHYSVTVTVTGPGQVTGSGDGGSIDCPGQCSALIKQQTSITLTATPNGGAAFGGWGGDCSGTGSACTLFVDGPKTVSAGFDQPPPPIEKYRLTVKKSGAGTGYVGGGGGIDCGSRCTSSLAAGTRATLLAVAGNASKFSGWSGACSGRGPCALVIHGDTSLVAVFTPLDRVPPQVKAMPGKAVRGHAVRLRFRVWDNSGRSRELVRVLQGRRLIVGLRVPMKAVVRGRIYAVRWMPAHRLRTGVDRVCVIGIDSAGNRSPRRCASLTIV